MEPGVTLFNVDYDVDCRQKTRPVGKCSGFVRWSYITVSGNNGDFRGATKRFASSERCPPLEWTFMFNMNMNITNIINVRIANSTCSP